MFTNESKISTSPEHSQRSAVEAGTGWSARMESGSPSPSSCRGRFRTLSAIHLSTLAAKPDIKVVGEVSNGFAAVNKSLELQPDLILLDIGLPGLDGINAARQIRNLAPDSKVIFLTQESSADIVQEALSVGARGYVLKIKAASELLRALEAVLLGKTFVSSTMGSQQVPLPT